MCSNGHWTFVMPGQRLSQHRSGAALCVTAKSDVRCPLWVKSRHCDKSASCPLYPQKRTLVERIVMSALCQKRTLCGAAIDGTYWAMQC